MAFTLLLFPDPPDTMENRFDTHHLCYLLWIGPGVLIAILSGHQQPLLMALHIAKDDSAALLASMTKDAG